jgi:predicted transcriptional regulator of viral defense system
VKRGLGPLETKLLAYAQLRGLRTVRVGELRRPLRLSVIQERKLLNRMARAGLIARVWRGLYLLPPRLPLGGKWNPDEALALSALMTSRKARYQICGPNAFNRYGFDDQVANRVYAYNDRLSGERTVGAVALTLIKVDPARLGDTEKARTADGLATLYGSRARTLVDAVYDWSRFNSLPRAFEWIRAELAEKRVGAAELVRITLRYGDVGTIRRIGALLDREDAPDTLLRRLQRALKPTSGLIAWNPASPKRGTVDRRWGVVWNDRA